MLLGKRPRGPIKRTTSMTEFTLDLGPLKASQPPDQGKMMEEVFGQDFGERRAPGGGFDPTFVPAAASPRNHRRNSTDFALSPQFLKACGLCNRRLVPGRDIYMYRGDTAFCSLECRKQVMKQDERKDKCSVVSVRKETSSTSAGSEASSNGETVAAA